MSASQLVGDIIVSREKLIRARACWWDEDDGDDRWYSLTDGRKAVSLREVMACESVTVIDRIWVFNGFVPYRTARLFSADCKKARETIEASTKVTDAALLGAVLPASAKAWRDILAVAMRYLDEAT